LWLGVGCIVSHVVRGEDMKIVSKQRQEVLDKRQRRDVGYRNFNRMLDLILQEGVNRYVNAKNQLELSEGRGEGDSNTGLS
jgi:hypothetical protein